MAKKDKDDRSASRADAVRSAVDQAFSASAQQAEQGRERAQDIVDQLGQAAGRVREVLDDLRPPTADELRDLREQVARLERRVAALEAKPKPKPQTGSRTTTRKKAT